MRILAFDQSASNSGWAYGRTEDNPHGSYEYGSIRTPQRDEFGERLAIIFDVGVKLIEKYPPELIAYEQPYFPQFATQGQYKPKQDGYVPATGFLPSEIGDAPAEQRSGNKVSLDVLCKLQMVKGTIITLAAL